MIYEELPGDVFDVMADYYCHACNCRGSWGAGIAAQFKERFPFAYEQNRLLCEDNGHELLGLSTGYGDVICLYTSNGYGRYVDPAESILKATRDALVDLKSHVTPGTVIASPRFNAGLFNVPWEKTREILLDVFKDFDITWKVRYL